MSQDYYIGLRREQVEMLLKGHEVGKRPYFNSLEYDETIGYDGTVRIHVKMLSKDEAKEEPERAFDW